VKEAKVDLHSAWLLSDGGEYSRSVGACQQAVEKAVKWVIQEIVTFIEQEYHLKLQEE
jgi:HEPN domain-containing protein